MKTMQLALVATMVGASLTAGAVLTARQAWAGPVPTNPNGIPQITRAGGCMPGFAGSTQFQGNYACSSPAPRCAAGSSAYDLRIEAGVFRYSCSSHIPG